MIDVAVRAAGRPDLRCYRIVAVGIRRDGAIVTARNGAAQDRIPTAHAERRLARKLDIGSIVWVVRVRADGQLAMAKPCLACLAALRAKGVRDIWYSTDDGDVRRMQW